MKMNNVSQELDLIEHKLCTSYEVSDTGSDEWYRLRKPSSLSIVANWVLKIKLYIKVLKHNNFVMIYWKS